MQASNINIFVNTMRVLVYEKLKPKKKSENGYNYKNVLLTVSSENLQTTNRFFANFMSEFITGNKIVLKYIKGYMSLESGSKCRIFTIFILLHNQCK